MTAERATWPSTLIVSAYEGALLQSRIAAGVTTVSETITILLQLIQQEMDTNQKMR